MNNHNHRESDQKQQPDELAVYEAVIFRDYEEDQPPEDAGVDDATTTGTCNNNVVETSSTSTTSSNRTRDDKDTVFLVKIFCLIAFVYAVIVLYLAGDIEDIASGNTRTSRSAGAEGFVSSKATSTVTIHHQTKVAHQQPLVAHPVRYQPASVTMEGAAVDLTEANFEHFLEQHEMAFVNFCAPGATFCVSLAPTWEEFAQEVNKEKIPIGIGKVDCMTQAHLCRQHYVIAFPTMRWFNNGTKDGPDYSLDRTVDDLMSFSTRQMKKAELGKN